jgi:hypothetical protein
MKKASLRWTKHHCHKNDLAWWVNTSGDDDVKGRREETKEKEEVEEEGDIP